MRMSCNGCRVLRKGCSDDCTIRPCLQWIKSPEEQGNATLFLAKFYGRAGLLNLIGAGPGHLRPAIFRSLLYEACGRIVNPIFGSVGLLWSNNWPLCQAAVEAVLKGKPITQIPSEKATGIPMPPLKAFDIRHVPKKGETVGTAAAHVHKMARTSRAAFKREGSSISSNDTKNGGRSKVVRRQESSPSDEYRRPTSSGSGSMVSVETLEVDASTPEQQSNEIQLDLTLTLGSYAKATSQPTSFCIDDPIGGGQYDRSSA